MNSMESPGPDDEELFAAALALDGAAERRAFLARACAGREERLAGLLSLVEAHEGAGEFLERPARPPAGEAPETGPEAERRRAGRIARTLVAAEAEEDFPRLPGFRLRRRLGTGAAGAVYEAWDETLDRVVAVKVLHLPPGEERRRLTLQEARRAAALQDPALVAVHGVIEAEGLVALVMERAEGYPIDAATAALSFAQRAQILREVSRALALVHAAGMVHCDLKPANVVVSPGLRPKLLDFGLAAPAGGKDGGRAGFAGTPLYASPERAAGLPPAPAGDVFSFGSLMFTVLTGRPPFTGRDAVEVLGAVGEAEPPFPRDLAAGVPEDLQAICLACLSRRPEDRPEAAQVTEELGRFLAGEPARLRPALYGDILRRRLAEHAADVEGWARQGMIGQAEADRLRDWHRRVLADEDHWIVGARRITPAQAALNTGAWLAVVAAALSVWLGREELGPTGCWLWPLLVTSVLLGLGARAERRRERLASATFLAAAALSLGPALLAGLGELGWLAGAGPGERTLFGELFSNRQVFAAALGAFGLSVAALARLRLTGLAWTTAGLGVAAYFGWLLVNDWLAWTPEMRALGCLPLVAAEAVALALWTRGRARWATPFDLVALLALVGSLDALAWHGPTLRLLGLGGEASEYFTDGRLRALSFALNGGLFLGLAALAGRASQLDLRRVGRTLEWVALPHWLLPLYVNASSHQGQAGAVTDAALYLGASVALLLAGVGGGRWRWLVAALGGLAFGCHLLLAQGLVRPGAFLLTLGAAGLGLAFATYVRLRRVARLAAARRTPDGG